MKLLKNLKLPKLSSIHVLLFIVCVIALIVILYYKKNRDGFTANITGTVYGNQNNDFNKLIRDDVEIPEPLFDPKTEVALGYPSTIEGNWSSNKSIGRIYRYDGTNSEYKGFYVCVFKGQPHLKLSYFQINDNRYKHYGAKYVEYNDGIRGENSTEKDASLAQKEADKKTYEDQQSFRNKDSPDNIGLWPPNKNGIQNSGPEYNIYRLSFIKVFNKNTILEDNEKTIEATQLNKITGDTPSFSVLKSAIQLENYEAFLTTTDAGSLKYGDTINIFSIIGGEASNIKKYYSTIKDNNKNFIGPTNQLFTDIDTKLGGIGSLSSTKSNPDGDIFSKFTNFEKLISGNNINEYNWTIKPIDNNYSLGDLIEYNQPFILTQTINGQTYYLKKSGVKIRDFDGLSLTKNKSDALKLGFTAVGTRASDEMMFNRLLNIDFPIKLRNYSIKNNSVTLSPAIVIFNDNEPEREIISTEIYGKDYTVKNYTLPQFYDKDNFEIELPKLAKVMTSSSEGGIGYMGDQSDKINSFKTNDFTVILYEDPNFEGGYVEYPPNSEVKTTNFEFTEGVRNDNVENKVSSLKIRLGYNAGISVRNNIKSNYNEENAKTYLGEIRGNNRFMLRRVSSYTPSAPPAPPSEKAAPPAPAPTSVEQKRPEIQQKADKYTYSDDISHIDCLEKCLGANVKNEVCFKTCGDWAQEQQKKLENCFFRPGGLTPGDCKTRCEDYYSIVDPNNTVCKSTCEDVCKKCDTADCKWTNFQSEEEFPYQLSIFGVVGNRKVTISWEKPPYAVKKYIIMYFEEEQQHTKGVHFEEKMDYECDPKSTYCTHVITELTNNKNYIIGVSVIFQNNDVTRMSNRLLMRPIRTEKIGEVEKTEEKKEETIKQESKIQTRTPAQILTAALLREKRKANSQKILTEFKKSQAEQISDLFSYLATNPINLQFKLS